MRERKLTVTAFVREEKGVAMTEYLIVLALLLGGTLLAIAAAGQNLSSALFSWADYYLVLAGKAVL